MDVKHENLIEDENLIENENLTDDERGTSRLEALSDGVIAVAITLLVLDIHVPETGHGITLFQALTAPSQLAAYLGYVTSFLVIGIFWSNHHNMFKHIKYTDHLFLMINILFLMCIVFIPFATSLLTRYIPSPDMGEKHTAAIVYSLTLLVNGMLFNGIWWYAIGKCRLLRETTPPHLIRKMTWNNVIGVPIYLLSLIISLFSVEASLVLYILVALLYAAPTEWLHLGAK